jgi:hypothetical protein
LDEGVVAWSQPVVDQRVHVLVTLGLSFCQEKLLRFSVDIRVAEVKRLLA